jgi:(p)ppGpp synthase/HD superfamily hydrolase
MINLIEKAKEFAIKAHEGQFRKTAKVPYITHPIAVSKILADAGLSDELVAAGYLHDTVEDTLVTIEEIEDLFGKKVGKYVRFNTENKALSWEERKTHTIKSLPNATLEERALVVADKYDNLSSLLREEERLGEDVWQHFNRSKDLQMWYYKSVAENCIIDLNPSRVPLFFTHYIALTKKFN